MGPGFESLKVHQQAVSAPNLGYSKQLSAAVKYMVARERNRVSVSNAEGPPVPIPNTEVKLCCAHNTCLATDREDRSMPTSVSKNNIPP